MSTRSLRLGAFLFSVGHHLAAWRSPEVDARDAVSFDHVLRSTRAAEAAGFDAVFFADNVGLPGASLELLSRAPQAYYWEPLALLAALATQTSRIGLIATVSSTYLAPYHLARKFASLDHLSKGRVGWNLVTSGSDAEARNFGLDHQLGHAERYARAREYVEVVTGLWDSWEDDAHLFDAANGRFFDPGKVRALDHVGEFYAVAGPLQSGRPVQGHPVLVQAGSSEEGRNLAALSADVVFTAQQDLGEARAFAEDVKTRAAALGRARDSVLVMPGLSPFVAESREEARARFDALQGLVEPKAALRLLSAFLGVDATGFSLDAPLPDLPETEGWQSRQALFSSLSAREGLTVRDLIDRVVPARGHKVVVGTPADVADLMQEWFEEGACDGFNIMPPTLPGDLAAFNRLVIPELERRGLFRKSEGATLRERLGLERPKARYPAPAHAGLF